MYKEKYLKYKIKYTALKNLLGGTPKVSETVRRQYGVPEVSNIESRQYQGNNFIFKTFEEDGGLTINKDGGLIINKEGETSFWNVKDVILGFVNNDEKKKVIYVKVYIKDIVPNESSYFIVYLDETYKRFPAIYYLYKKIISQEENKELQLTFCNNLKQLLEVFLKYLQDDKDEFNRGISTFYIEQLESSIKKIDILNGVITRTSPDEIAFKSIKAREEWPEHRGIDHYPYVSIVEYLKI
jgi:hypothetical protein